MPTSLGPAEILVILVVALIVLGPKKLPEAGRQVGKALAEVRKWSQGFQDEIRSTIDPDAKPPSYSQPQPGYVPPSPPAVDAAPSPVETNGSSVTTGSHGLISGPAPAPAPAPAPVDPAPAAPSEPPTGDAPAT
jgi:Tat protein translocase TatB subunit